ncbi:MAG: ModE family transcriptional regulator [Rhizobacter sp.]|nr:ModE family transcriptional regulator [Rhizobacter sp.]
MPKSEVPDRPPRSPKPEVRLRLRVTSGGVIAIGPGKVDLLEAVATQGSISAAARSLGMSYRRAWLLLDELNHALKSPAITTATGGERGGGAHLTATGEAVIAHYRQLEAEALAAGASHIKKLLKLLREPDSGDEGAS